MLIFTFPTSQQLSQLGCDLVVGDAAAADMLTQAR